MVIGAKRCDVVVVCRQVHCLNSTRVRFEEGAHGCSRTTVPDNKHRVIAGVSCHHPLFVVTTEN